MTIKTCPDCGCEFEADQSWKKTCIDCYFERKEKTGERRVQQLQEQVEYWKALAGGDTAALVKKLERCCDQLSRDLVQARMRCSLLELETVRLKAHAPPRTSSRGEAIPADMLKRLTMLCHPDRHGGSEMSNRVTQWLLERRQ